MALVKSGGGTLTLAGSNTYTGGTYVNQATLSLGATGVLGTGGINLAGGTLSQVAGGVIPSQAVTINGQSTLTLAGANSLTGLTFNNNGGTAPNITTTGGILSLTGATQITASSNNVGSTAVVTAGTLDFAGNAGAITVNPISFNNQGVAPWQPTLSIAAVIQDAAGVTVSGGGVLQLSGANTFGGGVNVNGPSGILIGASSNPSTVGSTVLSGPLGTGTLTLGSGASLLSGGAFTVANPISAVGDFAFNGVTGLTLNGTLALQASSNTNLTVTAPATTLTVGGAISGASGITKLGFGALSLTGAANSYSGGTTISNGTLTIAADGSLGAAAGTLSIQNDGILITTANTTLNASRGFAVGAGGGIVTPATGTTLTVLGPVTATGPLTMNGAGTLTFSPTNGFGGTVNLAAGTLLSNASTSLNGAILNLSGGTVSLNSDGDGTGTPNTADTYTGGLSILANTTVTVNRVGAIALNKTIAESGTTSINGSTLTVTPSNGYGLDLTGAVTLTGAPTFSVGTATGSNVTQGLTIDGLVSSATGVPTGSGSVILTKTGTGTLALTNSGNTFGGAGGATGQIIDITGGMLAAGSDGALGNASNVVKLDVNSATQGFRATGSFATSRTFTLNQAADDVEVTAGNTLTLNAPFGIGAAADVLTKADNGVLAIGSTVANSTAWTGGITIAAGAVQLAGSANLLATTPVTVQNFVGAALQLTGGGVAYNASPLILSSTGINSAGALENVAGANTYSGAITLANNATIGADNGTTLNLTNATGILGNAKALTVAGPGAINISSPLGTSGSLVGGLTLIGTGATTLSASSSTLRRFKRISLSAPSTGSWHTALRNPLWPSNPSGSRARIVPRSKRL